jgi:hypothetical protein
MMPDEKIVHHVEGCRQMQRKEFDHWLVLRHGYYGKSGHPHHLAEIHPGQPGVEWWRKPHKGRDGKLRGGTLVKLLGPKPGCVKDWDKVTCRNCLSRWAKRKKELRKAADLFYDWLTEFRPDVEFEVLMAMKGNYLVARVTTGDASSVPREFGGYRVKVIEK